MANNPTSTSTAQVKIFQRTHKQRYLIYKRRQNVLFLERSTPKKLSGPVHQGHLIIFGHTLAGHT
jgi:hypothetical protein